MGYYNKMQNTYNYFNFNILDKVKLDLKVLDNPFQFEMENLFLMGARVNPKRSFLFISKLLGKHLEVHPDIPKLAGHLLANLVTKKYEDTYFSDINKLVAAIQSNGITKDVKEELTKQHLLKEKTLFIGFAETATGLGHAVFSAFENAYYVHTTREEFHDLKSVFDFQEEHSHATNHLCYLQDTSILENATRIVLVDDEITTGNTCLNLIKSLNQLYPKKHYSIVSLLDWRTKEHEKKYQQYSNELGIVIDVISLLRGQIDLKTTTVFEGNPLVTKPSSGNESENYRIIGIPFEERISALRPNGSYSTLLKATGRFGVHSHDANKIEFEAKSVGNYLESIRKGKRTLCIGNGEFMYVPSRIAAYMGSNIAYKSSTRSPIYVSEEEDYPIHDRIEYTLSNGVTNYIYNINDSEYDEVMFFVEDNIEKEVQEKIYNALISRGIQYITFVLI